MSLRVEHKAVELALSEDKARPIIESLTQCFSSGSSTSEITGATPLGSFIHPMSEMFELFKGVNKEATAETFSDFLGEITSKFSKVTEVATFLERNPNPEMQIVAYKDPDEHSGFVKSEPDYDMEGPLLGIVCGNLYQVVRITESGPAEGGMRTLNKHQDPSTLAHMTIIFKEASVQAPKKSSCASKCNPFGSRLSTITTLAVVAGIIAVAAEYFGGHTSTHVTPLLTWAWESCPTNYDEAVTLFDTVKNMTVSKIWG